MVEHAKRKKHHDKDKYYRLAKEQGFRSRAAFKLSQINRKHGIFGDDTRVVLDLCAAPGGWTQVAARCIKRIAGESLIVAVDILPIRSFDNKTTVRGLIQTIIGDITTNQCKADIRRCISQHISSKFGGGGSKNQQVVDVVLHDGAPNVGASYERDAYVQNEISLHALKCATQHLRPGGTFVTKIYRSRDYASYVWVVQQLFATVESVKPTASRLQSAETYLVCRDFLAPQKIDARLLDPAHVFEAVEGETTGGKANGTSKFNVFSKHWEQANKRQRNGYDLTQLDFSMRHVRSITDFIQGTDANNKDEDEEENDGKSRISPQQSLLAVGGPIDILSTSTGLVFSCPSCLPSNRDKDNANKAKKKPSCHCQFFLNHPSTTAEIKTCISDLKVLNKSDFKGLLTWRSKMIQALQDQQKRCNANDESDNDSSSGDDEDESSDEKDANSSEEEAEIQEEIAKLRHARMRENKKQVKKERAAAAKRRRRAAFGMDLNAIAVNEGIEDQLFSLATITNANDLEHAREVDLNQVAHDQVFDKPVEGTPFTVAQERAKEKEKEQQKPTNKKKKHDDDDDENLSQGEEDDLDEGTGYSYRLDRELDEAYDRYLQSTKKGIAGTKMAKRSKKLQRLKAQEEAAQDEEMILTSAAGLKQDSKQYVELLAGKSKNRDDDDSSSDSSQDDEDDESSDEDIKPVKKRPKKQQQQKEENPLIHKLVEPKSAKTARWFSNPLFESIGTTAQLAALGKGDGSDKNQDKNFDDFDDDDEEDDNEADDESNDETTTRGSSRKDKKRGTGLDPEDIIQSMPKTDKQKRHERRIKAMAREERRQKRKAKLAGEDGNNFELVPNDNDEDEKLQGMNEAQRSKVLEARKLIKAGFGKQQDSDEDVEKKGASGKNDDFEIVSASETSKTSGPLPIKDTRIYNSDNEDYDSDDYVQTLALGTMMLRRSKAKALVDASYNRFAWNDPEDLPDWFLDDENRHYRPQLPIPQGLLEKIRAKQLALSVRPIAKVAEARARKRKRANLKLAAAKKRAEAVVNSTEMTESMKLKAISKAMKGHDAKKPAKTYVVAKKGRANRGGKNIKLVDRRMKNDTRSMDRKESKRKKGKQGGLTGSKKRRHHS